MYVIKNYETNAAHRYKFPTRTRLYRSIPGLYIVSYHIMKYRVFGSYRTYTLYRYRFRLILYRAK